MNTSEKTSSRKPPSLFRRLNIRLPWLKLVAVALVGAIITMDLLNLTIPKLANLGDSFPTAPMSKHVKATERDLKGKKLVALTFDDGPSPSTTPALLDTLSKKNALATFFMLGVMANRNPDIVKRAEREGHEIANHTMYHQNLVQLSPDSIQSDIDESKNAFRNTIGHTPTLIRPPYGNINDAVRASAHAPLILWSVDTRDWESQDAAAIVATAMNQVHDGAIILMHDIYPSTVDAVSNLIDSLKTEGYEFATVSELAENRHASLSPGDHYYNFPP